MNNRIFAAKLRFWNEKTLMKEIKDIIQAYQRATAAGQKTALATVVQVEGSSYRRPGARMLIVEDGQLMGAISGGCLEGDALRKALLVMAQQQPMLVTYDTMDDDDASLGVGLGCNGIIQVLIEPIMPEKTNNPIHLLQRIVADRSPNVIVTLYSLENRKGVQGGTCWVLGKSEMPENMNPKIQEDAHNALINNTSAFKTYPDTQALLEFVAPPISLVIIGAGNDALPLMHFADILGWETKIVDGRANYARPERFATACQVLVSKPEKVLEQIAIDPWTAFTLMTHNFIYDKAMLRELCQKEAKYIGMLGPKKKLDRMLEELANDGINIDSEQQKSIYGPVGLDIGAETPEEIALSIIAEIKAVFEGRNGSFLRSKTGAIHAALTHEQ